MVFLTTLALLSLTGLPEDLVTPAPYASIGSLPHALDGRRLAGSGVLPEAWLAEGFPPTQRQAWPIGDWELAQVTPGEEPLSTGALRAQVERLAAHGQHSFVSPVFVGLDGGPVMVTSTLLVAFDEEHRGAPARSVLADFAQLSIVSEDWGNMQGSYKLSVASRSGFEVLDIAASLSNREGVQYAEPDWIFTGRGSHVPNDPQFTTQWGLNNTGQTGGTLDVDMNLPEAWDITTGSTNIKVLIIDTGVQQDHPDLHQLPGADLTNEGPGSGGPVNNFDNHGTAVAGCTIATMDNDTGIAGVAPDCWGLSARTFISINSGGSWTASNSWTVDALAFAESNGVRVTNNSNFYGITSGAIQSKYQSTRNAGMVHFASAGNDGASGSTYPASLGTVSSISAINQNAGLTNFSNFGSSIMFGAPGREIRTTDRTGSAGYTGGSYATVLGTSFASPLAAGVAALLLSADPSLSASEVESIMRNTAKDLGSPGFDGSFGWGLPDAHAALLVVVPPAGTAFCTGDGNGAVCPCLNFGSTGEGCANSLGNGAELLASGTASTSQDSLQLTIEGSLPGTPGLLFQGTTALGGGSGIVLGNGLLCFTSQNRWAVQFADASGAASYGGGFLSTHPAVQPGATMLYQWWYRDAANTCGNGFNFSNGMSVTWQ